MFINVSAAPHTIQLLQAQGFQQYNDGQFLTMGNPFSSAGNVQVRTIGAKENIDYSLNERELIASHLYCGCTCVICLSGGSAYPFLFRSRVFRKITCNQLIYCRDIEEYIMFSTAIGRFFARRGKPIVMMDYNKDISRLRGIYLKGVYPKLYKGPVHPRAGDLSYTETALFGI